MLIEPIKDYAAMSSVGASILFEEAMRKIAKGEVRTDSHPNFASRSQNRWGGSDTIGDTFAVLVRKEGEPSSLSQTVKRLPRVRHDWWTKSGGVAIGTFATGGNVRFHEPSPAPSRRSSNSHIL